MMLRLFSCLILLLTSLAYETSGQVSSSAKDFVLDGIIEGRDTGKIVLWYFNHDNDKVADTFKVENGKFHFSGTINRACEALLWTNLQNRNFDDPSVVRFLLEPTKVRILYKMYDKANPVITGSKSQDEKRMWDNEKRILLNRKKLYYAHRDSVLNNYLKDTTNLQVKYQWKQSVDSLLLIFREVAIKDVQYIMKHPQSFLSCYLLDQQHKRLSVDSLQMLYENLSSNVKRSSIGYSVLSNLYPLTDDNEFRKANPLISVEYYQRLRKTLSIHDLSLKNPSGEIINLASFKGKYLIIDFWASWCKPCLENIPALNNMIKSYKSEPIEFISISLDKNTASWKQALSNYNLTGLQLSDVNGFNSLAAIYCKAIFVPTYVIVDPEGKIIKYNAPQAIDPELTTLIRILLNKDVHKSTY